jgi:hypothetical protein
MPAQLANESFRADHVCFGNSVGAIVQVLMRSDIRDHLRASPCRQKFRWPTAFASCAGKRCSSEQNALHTLIHQRHLTPSCGGHAPTAERTLHPARMLTESLTPRPELENSQDPYATFKMPRCCNTLSPAPRPPITLQQASPHGPPAEKGKLSYLTDRSHAENARMIFSRGWPCLRTT